MIYIVDHKDSFTYNLVHLFSEFDVVCIANYFEVNYSKMAKSKLIVFSSGPGAPNDYPATSEIYKKFKGRKKIIGICLGFQQILFNENGEISQQKKIYHGYQSKVKTLKTSALFKENKIFRVGRYHSLKLKEPFKSKNFQITMRSKESNVAMAFENQKDDVYGFQFHPESFLTTNGKILIKKILQS